MRGDAKKSLLGGIHVGRTNITAGVFDTEFRQVGAAKMTAMGPVTQQAVLDRIANALNEALGSADAQASDLRGVGVGLPGSVDPNAGTVTLAVNLGWKDVPAGTLLEEKFGVPVFIDNDANLSLLGIYEQELRRQQRGVILGVFFGSGIGGALLCDGELYRGQRHSAAEVGHMIIRQDGPLCACGRRGCFEALASRTAVFREIEARIKSGEKTVLTEMLGPELAELRSGHLRKALRHGDQLVHSVLQRTAEHMAVGLSNLILIFDPGLVVLGGGLMEAVGHELLPLVQRLCGEMLPKASPSAPDIVLSSIADTAGTFGGAIVVSNRFAACR
jgi:glucokinase